MSEIKYTIYLCEDLELELQNAKERLGKKLNLRKDSFADFIRVIIINTYRYLDVKEAQINKVIKTMQEDINNKKSSIVNSKQFSKERQFINNICKYFILQDSYNAYNFASKKKTFSFRTTHDTAWAFDEITETQFPLVEFLTSIVCFFAQSSITIQNKIIKIEAIEKLQIAIRDRKPINVLLNHVEEKAFILPYKIVANEHGAEYLLGYDRTREKLFVKYLNDVIDVDLFLNKSFEFEEKELIQLLDFEDRSQRYVKFKLKNISKLRPIDFRMLQRHSIIDKIDEKADTIELRTKYQNALYTISRLDELEIIEQSDSFEEIREFLRKKPRLVLSTRPRKRVDLENETVDE